MKNDGNENVGPPVTRLVLLGGTKIVILYICVVHRLNVQLNVQLK